MAIIKGSKGVLKKRQLSKREAVLAHRYGRDAGIIEEFEDYLAQGMNFEDALREINEADEEGKNANVPARRDLCSNHMQLRSLLSNPDELEKLYTEAKAAAELATELKRNSDDQAGFFNRPEAAADLEYWIAQPAWTIEEATALCLLKDPRLVNTDTLKITSLSSPFRAQFERVHDTINRAVAINSAGVNGRVVPEKLLGTSGKARPLPVAGALARAVKESKTRKQSRGSGSAEDERVDTRELHKLDALLIAIAVKYFKYEFTEEEPTAVGNAMHDELTPILNGLPRDSSASPLSISGKLIAIRLKEAALRANANGKLRRKLSPDKKPRR